MSLVAVHVPQQRLERLRVLVQEDRDDLVDQQRIDVGDAIGIGNGDRFDAVGRARAQQEILPVAQDFNRRDGHRLGEEIELENGLIQDPVQLRLGHRGFGVGAVRGRGIGRNRSRDSGRSRSLQEQAA